MAIPATILPLPALRGGEDFAGVAAVAVFGVEDSALEELLAEGDENQQIRETRR
jgi:hypothetical protein